MRNTLDAIALRTILCILTLITANGILTQSAEAITLTSVTISGPQTINVGSTGTFELNVAGTGIGSILITNLHYTIFDQDPGHDNPFSNPELIHETDFAVGPSPNGAFQFSTHFTLEAVMRDNEPQIRGADGTSDETNAEVFAGIEGGLGGNLFPISNVLTVTAVAVPEPNTLGLLALAFGVVFAFNRHILRRHGLDDGARSNVGPHASTASERHSP